MKIRILVKNQALVVRPCGELTEDAAHELLHEVRKELAPRPRDVVLDLAGVDAMSARALPFVFRIQQHADAARHRMIVTGARDSVQRLFDLTHVSSKLDFAEDEEAALAGA